MHSLASVFYALLCRKVHSSLRGKTLSVDCQVIFATFGNDRQVQYNKLESVPPPDLL
jgi:hypothetical protein